MKKFAILFAALCLVALFSSESSAQCRGGGGFYGGYSGGFRGVSINTYRPAFGISYGNYARPYYGGYARPYYGYARPVYGGGYYRGPGCGYRGVSVRF